MDIGDPKGIYHKFSSLSQSGFHRSLHISCISSYDDHIFSRAHSGGPKKLHLSGLYHIIADFDPSGNAGQFYHSDCFAAHSLYLLPADLNAFLGDLSHHSGHTCVDIQGQSFCGFRSQLALFHMLSRMYHGNCRLSDMLT